MDEACSSYLQGIKKKYAGALDALPNDDKTALQFIIEKTHSLNITTAPASDLRSLKAQFAYRWATARLKKSIAAEILGQLQTEFAQATINTALKAAWADKQFDRVVPPNKREPDGSVPGLFILGLGKLGGFDLNFSSDVDLVAFYDPATLPVASMHGRTDITTRVIKKLNQLLAKIIDNEFVWRVDWRLRPNASAMHLAMSTTAAEEFYFFHSYPWHRLAMIKSRVVAGDFSAGNEFLAGLEPYLWRQNLDYQMVDEIFLLKQKINQEHPQLKHARSQGTLHNQDLGDGFNLKLGRGGIREIEFIANAMQLLWGGKKPQLRSPRTLTTLQQLQQCGLLKNDDAQRLSEAYDFYRLLEDSLQILDNSQTHQLPRETEQLQQLLGLLEQYDTKRLWAELSQHRKHVITIFDGLLDIGSSEDKNSAVDHAESLTWVSDLPPTEKDIFESWNNGFAMYGISHAQSDPLKPLFIQLAELLDASSIDRAGAIIKLHDFFRTIPKGGQYLRLLAQHPALLNDIVQPLLYSPHMSSLLEQSPHIVDLLLEPHSTPLQQIAFDSEFVLQTTNFETRLERLRRFVNEQLYLHCLQLVHGQLSSIELQQRLTALAEHTIELGLAITNQEMNVSDVPIAIIGMGKLGMRAMAPKSDLDLIFIARDGVELEHANQYSSRFQHLMELRTREGRGYEMDMRLRPSGRSGPVTVSLRSFADYQNNNAKTWEHIALSAGRPVAGPLELQNNISAIRASVLGKPREQQQLKFDAAKMLRRLQTQRIGNKNKPGLNIKLRSGGLMELDYLSACACLLAEPGEALIARPYDEMIKKVCDAGQLGHQIFSVAPHHEQSLTDFSAKISEATNFWRRLQIWSRVMGLDDMALSQLAPHMQPHLLKDMGMESLEQLEHRINETSAFVSASIEALQHNFEHGAPTDWEDWQELPVKWR